MFNKRHYEAIALAIQEAKRTAQDDREFKGVIYAVLELADMFGRDNSRFQRERFIAACQPNANVKLRTRYKVVS